MSAAAPTSPEDDVVVSSTGVEFSNQEAMAAALGEQALAKDAQIEFLTNRNYYLRAINNRFSQQINELQAVIAGLTPNTMSTQDTLLAYSEWLDSEGLIISPAMDGGSDSRSHDDLAEEFITQWKGSPLAGHTTEA